MYSELVEYCGQYDMVQFGYYGENEEGKRWIEKYGTSFETAMSHNEIIKLNYPKSLGFSKTDIIRWNHGGDIYSERAKCMVWQFVIKADIIREKNIRFKEEL